MVFVMVRALGIDPGTRSFDLVVLEDGNVTWERSVDTVEVAKNPQSLLNAIEEAEEVDLISGPSGYGVPITYNHEILDPRRFALEILLLTSEEELARGLKEEEIGIMVYDALAKIVVELWRRKLPVCYIPSVILLPTVPSYRKINKLDMGTADKLSVAVLGVVDQSNRLGIDYQDTSFIIIEMGFGYNAIIGVDKGRIVDGLGGTLVPLGFLTIGPVDTELVVKGDGWSRSDVFHGGVYEICGSFDLDEIMRKYLADEEPFKSAVDASLDNIFKLVKSMTVTIRDPKEIILSGRLIRNESLRKIVSEILEPIAPIAMLEGLPNVKFAKEAAQGYVIVCEGIAGGIFKELIEYMKIKDAKGTVMDWVYHPRLLKAKERLKKTYMETVKSPKI